jgi:hypothetical protein
MSAVFIGSYLFVTTGCSSWGVISGEDWKGSPTAQRNRARSMYEIVSVYEGNLQWETNQWKTARADLRDRRGWVGTSVEVRIGSILGSKSLPPELSDKIRRVMVPGADRKTVESTSSLSCKYLRRGRIQAGFTWEEVWKYFQASFTTVPAIRYRCAVVYPESRMSVIHKEHNRLMVSAREGSK